MGSLLGKRVIVQPGQEIESEQAMMTIAFRVVLPSGAASIPARAIIAFRNKYAEERGAFQTEVTKMMKDLDYIRDMQDSADIQPTLQTEYEKRLAGKLKRLEDGMRRRNWDVIAGDCFRKLAHHAEAKQGDG